MLNTTEFTTKIVHDLKKYFEVVELTNNTVRIQRGATHADIPLSSIINEYEIQHNYQSVLVMYTDIVEQVLNTYKFTLDLNLVYPLVKPKNFGSHTDLNFIREPFQNGLPIDVLYATDHQDLFRFVQVEDLCNTTVKELKDAAFCNINRIANKVIRLSPDIPVFTFKFTSDLNSSLILNTQIQSQIVKKVGKSYYFLISSSSCAFFSPPIPDFKSLLLHLATVDTDNNKVFPDKIFKFTNGIYTEEL